MDNPYLSLPREELLRRKAELENDIAANGGSVRMDYGAMSPGALMRRKAELEGSIAELRPRIAQMDDVLSQMSAPAQGAEQAQGTDTPVDSIAQQMAQNPDFVPGDETGGTGELGTMGRMKADLEARTGVNPETAAGDGFLGGLFTVAANVVPFAGDILTAEEGERRLALADAARTGEIDTTWTDFGATTRALKRAARDWDESEGAKYDLYRRNAEGGALNEELGDIAKMERGEDGRLHPVLDENGNFVLDEKYAGDRDEARREAIRRHARGMLGIETLGKEIASRKVAKDASAWYAKGAAGALGNAGFATGYPAGAAVSNLLGAGNIGSKFLRNSAMLAVPVLTNALSRYYQLRADDVGFDENGNLRIADNGRGVGESLRKAALGSVAENVAEVVGGKAFGKLFEWGVGRPAAAIFKKVPGVRSLIGASSKAPNWLKRSFMTLAEGYGRMQNYTHFDGLPGEFFEEYIQGAFDDVMGLGAKDPREEKSLGQFTREFFDWDKNFKDLAVGMMFTMAGQGALGLGANRIRNQVNSTSREVRGVLKAHGWTDEDIDNSSYRQRIATAMSLSPDLAGQMRYDAEQLARLGGMSENDIRRYTKDGQLPYVVFALSDAMNSGFADRAGEEGGKGGAVLGRDGKAVRDVEKDESDRFRRFISGLSQKVQDALNMTNERLALDSWRGLTSADLDQYGDAGMAGKKQDDLAWFDGENGDRQTVDAATGIRITDVGGRGEVFTVVHPRLNTDYMTYSWESAAKYADRAERLAQAKEARRKWKQDFVQSVADRIVPQKDGGRGPSIRYYNTVGEIANDDTLAASVRERAAREGAEGGGQAVTLPDGSVAVFLDNIQTPGQAAVSIVHEIAGHGALDAFFRGKEGAEEKRRDLNRRHGKATMEGLGAVDATRIAAEYGEGDALAEELNVRAHEGVGGDAMSGLWRTATAPVAQGRFGRLASRLKSWLAKRTGVQFDLTPDEWDAVVIEGLERMAGDKDFPRPPVNIRTRSPRAASTRTEEVGKPRGDARKQAAVALLGYTPGMTVKDSEKLDRLIAAKRKWQGIEEFENAVAKYRDLVRKYKSAQAANKNAPKGEEKPYSKEQMKEMRDAVTAQWKVLQAFGESEAMQRRVAEKQTTQTDRDSGLGELFEAAENIEAEAEAEEEAETPKEPEKPAETPAPEVKEAKETPKEPPKEPPKLETPAKTPVEAPRSAPAEKATTTPPKSAESAEGGKSADSGAVQPKVEDEGKSEAQKAAEEQRKADSAAAPALKAVVDAVRPAAKFIEGGTEIPAGILNNLKYALRELKKHPYAHWDLPLGGNRKATLDDIGDANEAAKVLAEAVAKEGEAPSEAVVARLAELVESEIGKKALEDHDLDVIPREVREVKAKKEKSEDEQAQAEADEETRSNLVSAVKAAVESGDLSALKAALEAFKKDPDLSWNFGQGSGWNLDRLGANKNKAKWNRIPESIVNMGGQFILSNAIVTDFVRNVAGEGADEGNVKAAVAVIRDALGGAPAQRHAQAVVNEDVRAERREKVEMNSQARRMARANEIAGFMSRHFGQGDWNGLQMLNYLKNISKLFNLVYPFGTTEGAFHTPWPTDGAEVNEWMDLHFNWDEATGRDPMYTLWLTGAEDSDYRDIDPYDADILTRKADEYSEEEIVPRVVDYIAGQRERFDRVQRMWESLPESLREQIGKSGISGKTQKRIRRRLDRLQRDLYAQAEKALADFQETRDLAKAEKAYKELAESYDAMDDDAKQVVAALSDLIDERRGMDEYIADAVNAREIFLAAHPDADPFAVQRASIADMTREDIEEARDFLGDEAADRLQREKDLQEADFWGAADAQTPQDDDPLPFRKAGLGAVERLLGGGDRTLGTINRWRIAGGGRGDADGLTDADRRIRAATMEAVRRAAERNGGRVNWDDAQTDADIDAVVDAATRELPAYAGASAKNVFTGTKTTDGELFAIFNDPKQREGDRHAAAAELFRRNYPYILGHMLRKTAGDAKAADYAMRGFQRALGYIGGYWKYTKGKGGESGDVLWVPVRWVQRNRTFSKERDFRNYFLKTAVNLMKQDLRREQNKKRMGNSVLMTPVSALVPEGGGIFDENGENAAENFLDAVDARMRNADGTGAPTDKERQYRFERAALERYATREYFRWLDTLPERDRQIMEMHGAEMSIREIADEVGMSESAVKSRVSVLTMKMQEAVQNPFLGVLRGATSGGSRNYEQFVMALPRQERIVWLTHRTTGGDRAAIRDALRRDWEAMRRALESGNEKALAAREMSLESAQKEVDKWERRRARSQERGAAQGDLFGGAETQEREPWDISDQHITTLVNRTKAKLAAAGMNEDGTPRTGSSMSGLAQGLLTPEAAKEASGVPMMARREQAKETPKAESAPAPSIPGLKRRERAVQGDLFDMKWRKSASPEQQRIIGILEKLMTNEGTPETRWRKAQDVLKKEGLLFGNMTDHMAKMEAQAIAEGKETRFPSSQQTGEMKWRKSAPFSAEADSAAMTEDERRTIEEMRRDPRFSYSGYMAERAHDRTGELARGEAKLASATSFLEKVKLFFTDRDVNQFVRDRIREGLQDQHIHLRRMEERMFGGLDKIDKGADLYYFRDANIGRAGDLEMQFDRELITPLHDEIKKLGEGGMDRLNLVLNALHAPERNRMIAERTDGKTLDGSGMTTAFAKAVLDKAAADGFLKAEFDPESKTYKVTGGRAAKAVGLVRRIIDNTRRLQVQSGRKSAADAENEAKLSPNYVPLRTDMEDTLKEFAHAFGRQSLADSPVAYSELLLKAAMSGYYENVERRRLAQLVQRFSGYGMVFNTAAGDILTETQVERFKKFLDYMKGHGGAMTERMAEELEPLGIASQEELEARLAASGEGLPVRKSLVNGKVRESVDTAALDRKYPDIVSYMRDGQVWFVRLGGEKLSKAEAARIGSEVKKSGMLRLNLALKMIRKATRWFSQMRTSYSPEFLVSNFFADNRQAVQNIMSTFGAKAAAQFERKIGSVFGRDSARSSAARYLRGELDPAKYAIDRYTQEWAKNGGRIGGMSFSNFKDVDDGIRKLVRDYEQAARGDKKLVAFGRKIKKGIEDLNAAIEMGTRIAAYATCRENGYSVPDAVSYSRDVTVNFDRRGNWTPVLNSLYAFSNASIQDVHRTLVAMGGPADWAKEGGRRGLAVLAGVALLGFLRAALGYGQDDPEEAVAGLPQYEYTSEYEKQDMFGLRVGGANYAIPIRGLARLPYYAGQKVYEVLADKTSAAEAAKQLGTFAAQNMVDPIGNADNLLQTVAPSIIRPAVEYAQNTNFAGNQIFRQPRSSKDVKSEMGYRNTQGTFKWAARALNELTGGSASRSGAIDMQPEKIQHIYSAITGSLGADLLRVGNFVYDLANGEDVLAVENARNIPFLRRVRRDLAANSRTFRDAKDRYEADLQDWNANEDNSAVRAEIARSAPYLADERWAQELKDLSSAAQKLMAEENKAEGEERKAAQELRMRVQALFIRRLKEPPRQTPFAREQKQAQKDAALFLKKRKESQKRTERRGRIPMLP